MTSQNATVLVVDDQDSGRFVKAQMLRRAGFTVHEAANGRDTLDVARTQPIDIVVLDVNLPDINGIEVGRLLREQHPGPPAIQILHVSSTAVAESDRAEGLNAGADAYLAEPMDASVLVATARALLRVRRAEQSLADAFAREQLARSEAEHANRLKDDFIATLSHELRTPLNALMGWIFQLRQTTLSESAKTRALDSLERNTRVQAQLINDLLDVSRITKGKLQLQIRMVDMSTVAQDAAESVAPVVERKNIAFDVSTESAFAAGDDGRLQQIVGNLLNNAIQFTPDGGRVSLAVTRDAGQVVVRVTDTGAGIDPNLLPYVFEPFRQGRDGLARVHGGLGLGLAVVHQLVELHDGQVSATSEGPGRGTQFTVRLPEVTPAADTDSAALMLSGIETVVVADTAEARETLGGALESSGATVSQSSAPVPAGTRGVIVHDRGDHVTVGAPALPASDTHLTKPVRPGALVRAVAACAATLPARTDASSTA
jgi:signal transduction histidine kinase